MTDEQNQALRWFSESGIGATIFEGRWVWPETIRRDPDLAQRIFIAKCCDAVGLDANGNVAIVNCDCTTHCRERSGEAKFPRSKL
jgi:hypothetical protein